MSGTKPDTSRTLSHLKVNNPEGGVMISIKENEKKI